MIDFRLTEEQERIRRLAHEFAEREIRPVAAHYDETEEMPWPVLEKAARVGLTSFQYPEEYGGGGMTSALVACLVAEELAWGCLGIATAIAGAGLAAVPIMLAGTPEQKARYLPRFCNSSTWAPSPSPNRRPGRTRHLSGPPPSARATGTS